MKEFPQHEAEKEMRKKAKKHHRPTADEAKVGASVDSLEATTEGVTASETEESRNKKRRAKKGKLAVEEPEEEPFD